ncbi:phosphopantetheine adenylyltransferase [Nonomuraea dietziae]|uniref:Phosphopantetheine adenylyltransferase n=1 Tax=Nonomuraea dietziae TaxID=65515 RepID=A0A7W5VC67_9ACTN|nr:phosphopantetheine adenylyltransferase [Nonomuraea dietziae]MBB3724952.1 hypothetical protein [Nonomuraea dietziae]
MRLSAHVIGMLLFGAVGLLNVLPGLIALMPSKLATAYGVITDDPTSTLLLRHRAVMLALLGGALLVAAFLPALRIPVLIAAAVGKLSFIALVSASPDAHAKLTSVALADVMALVALAAAAILTRAWTARA